MKLATIIVTTLVVASFATSAMAAGDKAKGAEVYKKNCGGCHGATGAGDGSAAASLSPKPTNFTDKNYKSSTGEKVSEMTDEALAAAITGGKKKTAMPKFKKLSEQDVADVVAYIRSL